MALRNLSGRKTQVDLSDTSAPADVSADVWVTTFRVSVAQEIVVPFTAKSPLSSKDSKRLARVTCGSHSENCELETGADTCTIDLRKFPSKAWHSGLKASLEYYDSSIPEDSLDSRPIPFVEIASLIPTGNCVCHI